MYNIMSIIITFPDKSGDLLVFMCVALPLCNNSKIFSQILFKLGAPGNTLIYSSYMCQKLKLYVEVKIVFEAHEDSN